MPEITSEPIDQPIASIKTAKTKKTPNRKLLDTAIGLIILIICVILAKNLINQLSLKHEVRAATTLSGQVINDIRKQNGSGVFGVGNKTFQSQNKATSLNSQFKTASPYTGSTPAIDRQTVTNDNGVQAVSLIYRFPKPVFYVRVIVVKTSASDTFQVANIKADTTDKTLVDNKY